MAVLLQYAYDPERAAQQVYGSVLNFPATPTTARERAFHEAYFRRYKQVEKPKLWMNEVANYLKGPVVVDVGSGPTTLAAALISSRPDVKRVIGTDLIDYRDAASADERIEFRRQSEALHIPLEDRAADTALLMTMLHHLDEGGEHELLKDVWRILKPGGRLVIVEDGYSTILPARHQGPFEARFQQLTSAQRKLALTLQDWIGTRLIAGPIPMNRPYNFKTLEEWEALCQEAGFVLIEKTHLGFLEGKFNPSPQVRLVMEKPLEVLQRTEGKRSESTAPPASTANPERSRGAADERGTDATAKTTETVDGAVRSVNEAKKDE